MALFKHVFGRHLRTLQAVVVQHGVLRHTSPMLQRVQHITTTSVQQGSENDGQTKSRLPRSVAEKFKIFTDEDAEIILDVNEEKFADMVPQQRRQIAEESPRFAGLHLERGEMGVFDVGELVDVLRVEKAVDICVITVPPELKYADHLVIVTGRSSRHMLSMAEFIRKVFKMKMDPKDLIPKIEGEDSREWIAMDMGNIILHIFEEETRQKFDLETLWSVGAKYDDLSNEPADPIEELLGSNYLKGLTPAS